jgi:hypothetical protein
MSLASKTFTTEVKNGVLSIVPMTGKQLADRPTLNFPRPEGMDIYWIEDEIGTYYCITQECLNDLQRRARVK